MSTTANERALHHDAETGLAVTRWTDHPSNHLYFTNPGWFDKGRQLLFTSDRSGRSQLAALDLETGQQRSVTDCPADEPLNPYQTAVDPRHDRAFAWIADRLEMVDLFSARREAIFSLPHGWDGVIPNVTADGSRVVFGMVKSRRKMGFDEFFASRPRTQILVHELTTGKTQVIHEREVWMGHVNTSPTDPYTITFCHEGPWTRVEHRVWGCDLRDGQVWKVGPQRVLPACVGHEYWLADGQRISYHGYNQQAQPVLGLMNVRDPGYEEYVQPVKTKHSHSLDGKLVVGDGSETLPWILIWRLTRTGLEGPWKLCRHGGGWSDQRLHVHPRIAPDGRSVLFTSDAGGVPRVYQVELPDAIDSLPKVDC